MKNNQRNKACLIAAIGQTGGGKSAYVKRLIDPPDGLQQLIVDPMAEYHGVICQSLGDVIKALGSDRRRVVLRTSTDPDIAVRQFDMACRIAYTVGNITFVVEELKLFTKPNKAPHWWARLCLQGRHRGVRIIGTSQRPAHIDKDFLGNCTEVRVAGGFRYVEDARAAASAMPGVTYHELMRLKPLEFVHFAVGSKVQYGALTFKK